MKSIDSIKAVITALYKMQDASEAVSASVRKNPLQSYVMGQVISSIQHVINDMEALRYNLVNEADLEDLKSRHESQLSSFQKDIEHYKHIAEQYEAEHVANLPHVEEYPAVVESLKAGSWISAIKEYRAATGVGLKEAKLKIEEARPRYGYVAPV